VTDASRGGLLELAAALVAIPSVSHHEKAMADAVEAALRLCPWLAVERIGDNVVARTELGRSTRVVLAGHLDTVPPAADDEPRIVGSTLYGVGSVDMKGGLAVLLHLAGSVPEPAADVTWCFYSGEEVERRFNGLRLLFDTRPELLAGDVAILAEPTGGVVEAGCQGTLRVRMVLAGARAHTARPFAGRNAIHRLAPVLERVAAYRGRRPVLDGCEFAEQLQAVEVEGGVAANVVPDSASLVLNHRFAPDRTAREAGSALEELLAADLDAGDRWEVVDKAAGAPPALGHPVLASLVDAADAPPRAKVGWTDVATFWAHGIAAANFGPGDPLSAHAPGEHVSSDELDHAASVLERVLRDGGAR
jgi:succinyl-diaminopimelate desuccinylase